MKIKIISDGQITKVVNAVTGEEIEGIIELNIRCEHMNVEATMVVYSPQIEMDGVEAIEK